MFGGSGTPAAVILLAAANLLQLLWPGATPARVQVEEVVERPRRGRQGQQRGQSCASSDRCLDEIQQLSRHDVVLKVNVVLGLGNALCVAAVCWCLRGRAARPPPQPQPKRAPRREERVKTRVPPVEVVSVSGTDSEERQLALYVPKRRNR